MSPKIHRCDGIGVPAERCGSHLGCGQGRRRGPVITDGQQINYCGQRRGGTPKRPDDRWPVAAVSDVEPSCCLQVMACQTTVALKRGPPQSTTDLERGHLRHAWLYRAQAIGLDQAVCRAGRLLPGDPLSAALAGAARMPLRQVIRVAAVRAGPLHPPGRAGPAWDPPSPGAAGSDQRRPSRIRLKL